jgi:hypothetical protein
MMEWVTEHWVAIGFALTGIGYLLTGIAAITPNETDNKIAQFFCDAINKIGFNVGTSRNDPNA